jgi:hypothetical protein
MKRHHRRLIKTLPTCNACHRADRSVNEAAFFTSKAIKARRRLQRWFRAKVREFKMVPPDHMGRSFNTAPFCVLDLRAMGERPE